MGLIEIKETFDEELYKDSSAEGASGRDRIIIRTSVIGILANVLLAAFKAVVGLLTHSIAIVRGSSRTENTPSDTGGLNI